MDKSAGRKTDGPSVLVSVCEMGGFGDIMAAYNIALSLKREGLPLAISFDDGITREKFTTLGSGTLDGLPLGSVPRLRQALVVHPVGDRGVLVQPEEKIGSIHVLEYNKDSYRSNYTQGNIVMDTGLGFDSGINNPQAGIYVQQSLDLLLKEADEVYARQDGILGLRQRAFEEFLGESAKGMPGCWLDDIMNGGWSVYYPSTLDSKYTFFKMLEAAKPHLRKPLTVFCMTPSHSERIRKTVETACQTYGLSYAYYNTGIYKQAAGQITVVELSTIPQRQFQTLVSLADTASLVTGDLSFSQMLQKGMSHHPVPFFYELASWKIPFFESLCRRISSSEAVAMLMSYADLAGWRMSMSMDMKMKMLAPNDMATLFYDDAAIKEFTSSLAGIKDSFIREKQEAGVVEVERLWSVTDTVSFIAQRALGGRGMYDAVEPLLTSSAREQMRRFSSHQPARPSSAPSSSG